MSAQEAHIPAWKRIGLKQKGTATTFDPLKENVKRTAEQSESTGPKKPPKRAKLPKAERAPPPEPDQLAYLRKFDEDKANWKFSKQKQNWLLKNLFEIDAKYESALQKYFGDIQGASRERLVDQAKDCVKEWNEFMSKPLETPEETVDGDIAAAVAEPEAATNSAGNSEPAESSDAAKASAEGNKTKQKPSKAKPVPEVKPPTELAARRAQWFVEHLTGEKPELVLLE